MHALPIAPDLIVDHRRAAWFPSERVLAVADLHLGYAWAHRLSGQLMPITPQNDTLLRLAALQKDYDPAEIVLLGDIVHRAMNVPALESELRELLTSLSPKSQLTFLAGNHDRGLQQIISRWKLNIDVVPQRRLAFSLLVHGDSPVENGGFSRVVMGHEHPAISIGDGVTTSHKCPCFLVSDSLIVMPAFSSWAAGTNIRHYPLMSELARSTTFTRAVAICGDKLLPLSL